MSLSKEIITPASCVDEYADFAPNEACLKLSSEDVANYLAAVSMLRQSGAFAVENLFTNITWRINYEDDEAPEVCNMEPAVMRVTDKGVAFNANPKYCDDGLRCNTKQFSHEEFSSSFQIKAA